VLQFFVLGQIPGTHFVITFSWVLVMAALLLSFSEVSIMHSRVKVTVAATPAKAKAKTTKSAKLKAKTKK
jgi:hypothetical protein